MIASQITQTFTTVHLLTLERDQPRVDHVPVARELALERLDPAVRAHDLVRELEREPAQRVELARLGDALADEAAMLARDDVQAAQVGQAHAPPSDAAGASPRDGSSPRARARAA